MQGYKDKNKENQRTSIETDAENEHKRVPVSLFSDNRPEAIQMRRLQNFVQRSSINAPFQFIDKRSTIQRAVQLDGVAQNVNQIDIALNGIGQALNPARTGILNHWIASGAIHNFTTSGRGNAINKLATALIRAEAMPTVVPALFRAANLVFITQDPNRLATLYFTGGGQTGRLRQQHGSGPLASIDPQPKVRVSFANNALRNAYSNAGNVVPFVDPNPGQAHNPPVMGERMLEYYLDAGRMRGKHPSGGDLQPAPNLDDVAIEMIYHNIIGLDQVDPNNCSCCFITTACMIAKGLPDDCVELQMLRKFRDTYLINVEHGQELIEVYYKYSPAIVTAINCKLERDKIYSRLFNVIECCVGHIRRREFEEAFRIYVEMVLQLRDIYTPNMKIPNALDLVASKMIQ